MLVGGRIVLTDPTAGRTSAVTSSVSIGREILKSIEEHNEKVPDDKKVDTGPLSAFALSRRVMATVARKLSRNDVFKHYLGKKSFRSIKRRTELTKFNEAMDCVIKGINEEHAALSLTEGNWGATKAIVQKLRTENAHKKLRERNRH